MVEENASLPGPDEIPDVEVQTRRRISVVWVIPIVAALIGAWLAYVTISEKGPTITITFETAEGLEAGKTKLKYKDVEMGTVESVAVSDDLSAVIVTASLNKRAEPHLTESTRFWVVRPRLGMRGVSGLGTLVSGAFIEIDPGKGGQSRRSFKGLEDPPVVKANTPGRAFVLVADHLGSYDRGSPVYYRGIEVGEVLGHELAQDKRNIFVRIFIHAPHHRLVRPSSRFWNVSGIRVSLDANGMSIQTQSIHSLLLGGIAFETPGGVAAGEPSKEGSRFALHDSKEDVKAASFTRKLPAIMYFDGSVRGLAIGAPVEFRGIKLGSVIDIRMQIDIYSGIFRIAVVVELEPERFANFGQRNTGTGENIPVLIEKGLRARLKTGNIVTGQLFVDLDLHPGTVAKLVGGNSPYPEIPTIPSSLEEIKSSLMGLMAKIEKLPLERLADGLVSTVDGIDRLVNGPELRTTVTTLNRTMKDLNKLLNNLDAGVVPETRATLEEARATLATVRGAISEKSTLRYNLEIMLEELAAAARSIRNLTAYLERNPEALISGKVGPRGRQ